MSLDEMTDGWIALATAIAAGAPAARPSTWAES
jgi:hypothetical protein